jgi:hypothetical protein
MSVLGGGDKRWRAEQRRTDLVDKWKQQENWQLWATSSGGIKGTMCSLKWLTM